MLYSKMTDEWQKEINDKMKKLRFSFEALNLQKKMAPDSDKRKVETIIKEGEDLLIAIDKDKSRGVHNLDYTKGLMAKVEEKVLFDKKILSKRLNQGTFH